MPALVKSSVGSFVGTSEEDGKRVWDLVWSNEKATVIEAQSMEGNANPCKEDVLGLEERQEGRANVVGGPPEGCGFRRGRWTGGSE